MAKTLIGNIKGKDGRGVASIKKTGTTGSVDTYTITYTDGTASTFTINNADNISLQRQIVPSAAVESSATASQAYGAGDYVVVNGVLRKVKSAIAKGNAISDSNSTATTVTGELATVRDSVSKTKLLWSGSVYGDDTFVVPDLKEYTLVEVVFSNEDANHWGVLCFNDMNALNPSDNGYCIWVYSDIHAGSEYIVSIKSQLEVQKDLKTVKFAYGWKGNLMTENGTITSTVNLRIVAVYGVR